jgi:ABC transport system ATP-binding/permease protein
MQASNSTLNPHFYVNAREIDEDKYGTTPPTMVRQPVAIQVRWVDELHKSTGAILIGRGRKNHVQLKGQSVSRAHCRIRRIGLAFKIEDLGSAWGTYVNGVRVTSAWLDGDETLLIGETVLKLHLTAAG